MTINDKIEEFRLFCVNTGVQILSCKAIQYGQQFYVERNGEYAYMNIYQNGTAFCQASASLLKICLDAWAKRSNGKDGFALPDYYLSWREWNENAEALRLYIDRFGFPDEDNVPEEYDMNREIMFHDYMMRRAINKSIEWKMVEFVLESWSRHNCFMNLNIEHIEQDIMGYLLANYRDEVMDNELSFESVVAAVTNEFGSHCSGKWICQQQKGRFDPGYCPQTHLSYECLDTLIDYLYVYCNNQKVLNYNQANLRRLIGLDSGEISWIDLNPSGPLEEKMSKALIDSGIVSIPQFQACAPVHKYRIDFLVQVPNGCLAIECDGLEYHANKKAYIKDRCRDRELMMNGYEVFRFSSVDINNDIDKCVEQIDRMIHYYKNGKRGIKPFHGLSYFGRSDS